METLPDTPATLIENAEPPRPVLGYSNQSASPNVIIWCRLLAIGMFALGLERIAVLLTYDLFIRRYMSAYGMISVGVAITWPATAWYCWAQAPALALRIMRGCTISTGTENTVVSSEILSVSLLVLGLYEVLESLSFVTMIFTVGRPFHDLSDLPWREIIVPLARLFIGAWLIFRNHVATAYLRQISRTPVAEQEVS